MEFKSSFLLIEDNLIDQLVIKQLLKKVLYIDPVFIANNGKEGLQWLMDNSKLHKPLIILLDIQMPVMNGFEFLNEYNKLSVEFKKDIQVYVLSSTLDPDEITEINKNKAVFKLLSKPFPIEEFRETFCINTKAS